MFNNVQFEFKGFNPEYEVRNFISSIVERLRLNAPSDSAIKVAMKKGEGVIQASCRIASKAGTFATEVVCDNPVGAIEEIENKINIQLALWKTQRFLDSEL